MDPEAAILLLAAHQHWHALNDAPRPPDEPPRPRPAKPEPTAATAAPTEPGPGIDPKRDPARFAGLRLERY